MLAFPFFLPATQQDEGKVASNTRDTSKEVHRQHVCKNWIITFFLSVLLLWKNIAKDKKVIPDPIEPAVNRNIKYKIKDDYCRFSLDCV